MRITGGALRSRILRAPKGSGTRPTTDRVREALFSMLASDSRIEGARVLDIYAGTGALGFEALSRGAVHATFVESSRSALTALRANVVDLGLTDRTSVLAVDVETATARIGRGGPFDIVFADPPWALIDGARGGPQSARPVHRGHAPSSLRDVVARGALAPHGLLILEHSARSLPPDLAGLEIRERRRFGDTAIAIYAPSGTHSPPSPV